MAAELLREAVRAWTAHRINAGQGPTRIRHRQRWVRSENRWQLLDAEEFIFAARLGRQGDALERAARAYVSCGRDFVYHECQPAARGAEVHSKLTARYCMLSTICPECAARDAGRLNARYVPRIATAVVQAPDAMRLRLVTAGLRPHGAEAPFEAFDRCQPLFKSLLKICFGVPVTAQEWAVYFQLYPLSDREKLTAGTRARAKKLRRARVKADLLRRRWGAIMSSEFGEKGMKAHCHALVLGRHVEHARLSRGWKLLTGDSFVVDIREADVHDVREVLKYAVKFTNRTPAQLAAIYRATCGRRRVEAMGCFRGRCALELENAWLTDKPVCDVCGAPLKACGRLPHSLHAMGVRSPPPDYRFSPRYG